MLTMRDLRVGNCLDVLREMEAESVQCVVTSPPYWGLRHYAGQQEVEWPDGSRAAYGLEPTPQLYVEHTVQVLREIRRVLRPDGVVWWNIGDCYAGSAWQREGVPRPGSARADGRVDGRCIRNGDGIGSVPGLKPKDLVGMPWRVAFALQADGWWLRKDIIWHKPNPMPESVTDRPTSSHEYIFLLTKAARYFYDADAVREPSAYPEDRRGLRVRQEQKTQSAYAHEIGADKGRRSHSDKTYPRRNLRSVWGFPTVPYSGAHFAVFPPELPRRCILAGTPPKVCATCGAPWRRVTHRERTFESGSGRSGRDPVGKHGPGLQGGGATRDVRRGPVVQVQTIGWQPTCDCHGRAENVTVTCDECDGTGRRMVYPKTGPNTAEHNKRPYGANNPHIARLEKRGIDEACRACSGTGETEQQNWPPEVLQAWPTRPAIVLDPFAGSGTTLMVAEALGRDWCGIEISEAYRPLIEARGAQRGLLAEMEATA